MFTTVFTQTQKERSPLSSGLRAQLPEYAVEPSMGVDCWRNAHAIKPGGRGERRPLTDLLGLDHPAWDGAYQNPDIVASLLAQRRRQAWLETLDAALTPRLRE